MVVSLVPIVGEIYDGWTIYAQKDPITGEPLTLIGNAFTIIGLGTIAGSGKVAREIGERSLREIAERTGVHYDLVTEAAEEVIKETDLVAVTKQGKTGFDGLIKKIGERVAAKNLAYLSTTASKIANGHAYDKHIHEFAHLNIKTTAEFTDHVQSVILKPSRSHRSITGKEYFWHDASKTFVVIDPKNEDLGTAFIPPDGLNYYLRQIELNP